MRLLVTGGAGYIGSVVARALTQRGHTVEVLDNLSRGHRRTVELLGLKFHQCDLLHLEKLRFILGRGCYDAVLHFAGLSSVEESVREPLLYLEHNLVGGLNLLSAMLHAGVMRLVFSSTAAVYGHAGGGRITEDTPPAPVNPYGFSKLAFEVALRAHPQVRSLSLRYFNAVGASEGDLGEQHAPETHLVPRLLEAARTGATFQLYGTDYPTLDGTCVRDYIHVEDLARGHVLAVEKLNQFPDQVLNLGTGRGVSVKEVLATTEMVLGQGIVSEIRPRRPGDPHRLVADPSRAEKVLGFKAERSLEEAIRDQLSFQARMECAK